MYHYGHAQPDGKVPEAHEHCGGHLDREGQIVLLVDQLIERGAVQRIPAD